jgi:hypothetical protein
MLCYVMVPLLHTHQRRKQLGVVASCDIRQWEARSCRIMFVDTPYLLG